MYNVSILDANGKCLDGLIDKNGKEILPCKYEIPFDSIFFDLKMFIYKENGKYGIRNFNDEIIISPEYTSIYNAENKLLIVKVSGKEDHVDEGNYGLITLDGNTVLPMEFKDISIENDLIIARNDIGTTLYRIIRE